MVVLYLIIYLAVAILILNAMLIAVFERIREYGVLATARDSFGAFFIAYDPTRESDYTLEWTDRVLQGELFDRPDSRGIVLGEALADNLDAELGDKVVYTLTDTSGEIVGGMERLSGIITTGSKATDAAIVLMPIDTVRDVVGYDPSESTQLAIFLNSGRRTLTVSERIDALIGEDAAVLTWDVMALLHEVGLDGLEDRRPFELSGGQQQRVAIVRAIASDPAIVLADEPTANVDSETSEKLLEIMEELNRTHGVTFLFSTHDPAVMARAHRLVKLVDGRVAEDTVREAVA